MGGDGSATRQRVHRARTIVKDRQRYAKVSCFESVQESRGVHKGNERGQPRGEAI